MRTMVVEIRKQSHTQN